MRQIANVFFLFFLITGGLCAQTLELNPLYHSIGVKVLQASAADSCVVAYKTPQQSTWQAAFNPDKISIDNINQFRGSIFLLEENTTYEVKVTVYNGASGTTLSTLQATTLSSPSFAASNNMKWVSPSGTGNYTQGDPGNLNALFGSGQVTCGTTVVLKDGIYNTNGLQLQINSNCTEDSSILLMAEPGASPIIDAGTIITSPWTPHSSISNLYSTPTPTGTSHSNILVLGQSALYPYPSLTANALLGNYNLSALSFGYDGMVRDENAIWIKTFSGINPNDSVVIVSKASRFLTVYGNNRNAYLKIKGIEFRYFGKPILNSVGSTYDSYGAVVFDIRNAHHVYFDSCRFSYNTNHISFSSECNNITIQNSSFKHDAGKWTHAMIKKSNVVLHTLFNSVSSSRARGVETPAVFLEEGNSIVIRGNSFDGLNSGIECYFDKGLKEDVDIYNNSFIDNFDAIECDGLWSNLRVWKNEVVRPMAGISAAPPLIGPRFFYRNLFHGMKGRRNEQDDPYFTGCEPVGTNYKGQGIGIKTNSDYQGNGSPGNLYFFNNTFHAVDSLGFVFTSWRDEWRKATFINNAYSHSNSYPFFYFSLADTTMNNDFQLSSIRENYFSYSINSPIVKVKHIHGQYNCSDIDSVSDLQSTLSTISGSQNISIENPSQLDPLFLDMNTGGFELSSSSPLIDEGTLIQGFNDYNGIKPDVGAKESNFPSGANVVSASDFDVSIYPNPAGNVLYVKLPGNKEKTNIKVIDNLGNVVSNQGYVSGQLHTIDLEGLTSGVYLVEVEIATERALRRFIKIKP